MDSEGQLGFPEWSHTAPNQADRRKGLDFLACTIWFTLHWGCSEKAATSRPQLPAGSFALQMLVQDPTPAAQVQ